MKYTPLIVLTALLSCNSHFICTVSASEAKLYFKLGKKHNNCCQYAQAQPMIEYACQQEPDKLDYHLALWETYAFQNRWEDALDILMKAPIDPQKIQDQSKSYIGYYWACGYTHHQLGQKDRAQRFFTKMLSFITKTDHHRYWWLKGNAFCMLGKHTEAIDCWKRAIEKAGTERPEVCAILYHNIGQVALLDNDYDTAVVSLTKAIKRNPKRSSTYGLLKAAYHKLGHADISNYYYKKTIELDPTWTDDINNRCICY